MRKNHLFELILCIVLFNGTLYSQKVDFQLKYGADPLLYNGKLYRFFQPASTKGNPFLFEKFNNGEITLRGEVFTDLLLNFDIFNKQLILQYTSSNGGINKIVISEAWLEHFKINGSAFEPVKLEQSNEVLCKVIKSDRFLVAYDFRKELVKDNEIGATNMQFSKPIRTSFLISTNKIGKYTNNRSFLSYFSEEHKQEIKKYIRKYRISVKKSTDHEIAELLNFCDSLI